MKGVIGGKLGKGEGLKEGGSREEYVKGRWGFLFFFNFIYHSEYRVYISYNYCLNFFLFISCFLFVHDILLEFNLFIWYLLS